MINPERVKGRISFCHGGDAGDAVYSLPCVRALGGGVLYLNRLAVTREPMTKEKRDFLAPLLEVQPYIQGVHLYSGTAIAFNLNAWREVWTSKPEFGVSLAEWYYRTFKEDIEAVNPEIKSASDMIDHKWLSVQPKALAKVVIHRSERYHNREFRWKKVVDKYKKDAVFVGLKQEHEKFIDQFGYVPFHPVKDALEMAEIIEGAKLTVMNQSFPNAVAEGLKKQKVLEVFSVDPNCCFARPDFFAGWTQIVYLPDV